MLFLTLWWWILAALEKHGISSPDIASYKVVLKVYILTISVDSFFFFLYLLFPPFPGSFSKIYKCSQISTISNNFLLGQDTAIPHCNLSQLYFLKEYSFWLLPLPPFHSLFTVYNILAFAPTKLARCPHFIYQLLPIAQFLSFRTSLEHKLSCSLSVS